MSQHQGYGGRAGSGGHGVPVPVEPLHREGRDAVSQWEKAQAHRARFGVDEDVQRAAGKNKPAQYSLTALQRRRKTTSDPIPDVVA